MNNIPQQGFYFDGSLNKFGKPKHDYFYDGKLMTGVTSVLGIIGGDKTQNLIQWAANMAIQSIKDNGMPIEEFVKKLKTTPETKITIGENVLKDYLVITDELLEEARTAHRKKKEEAGTKGTDVHTEIEEQIKWAIQYQNGFIPPLREDVEEPKQLINFLNWASKNKVKFLESEKRLYSEDLFVAGTCDFTCEINGKRYVGDIKTGGVYDRIPHFQTAAYRMMLESMNEKNYEGSVIVNIRKDGKFNEEKDVMWSFDYQSDLEGFTAALKLYRLLNNY